MMRGLRWGFLSWRSARKVWREKVLPQLLHGKRGIAWARHLAR